MSEARWAAISNDLARHYAGTFAQHGATARGVDWGDDETANIRYDRMLDVRLDPSRCSLLDVGCGWGGLLDRALATGVDLTYTGVDLVEPMIDLARSRHPDATFERLDAFAVSTLPRHDYVVCNGILTQKLMASTGDLDAFMQALVRTLFDACSLGIAFNVMTSQVNFTVDNLFYKSPAEMVTFCQTLTRRFRLDHSYPLYEYTVHLYRDDAT